jgi:hypothetical protein
MTADPSPGVLMVPGATGWPESNGGQHRSAQLEELVLRAGLRPFPLAAGNTSELWRYILGWAFVARYGLPAGTSLNQVRHFGATFHRWRTLTGEVGAPRVLVWEDTHLNNAALPRLARRSGCRMLAVPMNLESLVPGAPGPSDRRIRGRLRAECSALRLADEVFTISREEQWFLAACGLAADYLPYHPPVQVAAFLDAIRRERRSVPRERWLVVGSVGNHATLAGMTELIRLLTRLPGGRDLPLDIAGFRTEQLSDLVTGTSHRLHGTVSQDQLAALLKSARAALVHQVAAAGCLGRIREMVLAGVPVIANPIAARNAHHLGGVHIYDSVADLHALLQRELAEPPPIERPIHAEDRFIRALRRLAGLSGPTTG